MVVCFVVEFSVSIEQTVEEESEANSAKREEADNFESGCHCRAHASTKRQRHAEDQVRKEDYRDVSHCCSL